MSKEILGRGWSFPVAVDDSGRIALSSYEDDIREAIRIILLTGRQERPMRPEFGAGLDRYLFDTLNSFTLASIESAVREALIEWEPRIQILKVQALPEQAEEGKLLLQVEWKVRATNTRFNKVFPLYLEEGGA